jgi:hypothetical protein
VASTAVPGTQLGPAPADVAWKASQWPGFEQVIASYGPSPLASTLSIRRLGISARPDLDMTCASGPELTVRPVRQRNMLLPSDPPVYRYESGSFSADRPVDGNGTVIDYPGLWRRIMPGHASPADWEPPV